MARGKRRVVNVTRETADFARSPEDSPIYAANWPVFLPVRALTFDATVKIVAASVTDSESRRVEGELAITAIASPMWLKCGVHYNSTQFSHEQ
jgi:hypothetical protein